jgi:hypothetical protein
MTYEATVEFKFDSTETSTHFNSDDFIPEQHLTLTAPAHDLTTTQMFKLFERFMLSTGYTSQSIMSGAMSLIFNEWVTEEQQRKVCDEYHVTLNEDLEKKFKEMKKLEEKIKEAQSHYVIVDNE